MGKICVYGLWHLGCVTAGCLAAAGFEVIGLDRDAERVAALDDGRPPIAEPGLAELLGQGTQAGRLSYTTDPAAALADAEVLWVTFDTPVDDNDIADVAWVRAELEAVRPSLQPGTLVLVSSQVPVGFSRALEREWRSSEPSLSFAVSPENLRLGQAIDVFRRPERVVVGLGEGAERERLAALFAPFSAPIEWMSLESAEMSKHALNGFLAISVAYTNELARICERVGADASEVERALRTEPRIGRRAYVSAGPPLAGGTLPRDIAFLEGLAAQHGLPSPVVSAVLASNDLHREWARQRTQELVVGVDAPVVAVLGLTYKPGTDTLRRSAAVDLAVGLAKAGARVRAFDPAIRTLPPEVVGIELADDLELVLSGADVAVVATAWPEFRALDADRLARLMRHPRVVDAAGFLLNLGDDPRIVYARVGRPVRTGGQ